MGFEFTCIQDSMSNKTDYIELGLACAELCGALKRGTNGKRLDDLSQPVCEAIGQLTTWVKQATHGLDNSLTILWITELWIRSRRWLSKKEDGIGSPDLSTLGMIKPRLRLGSLTSTGSFLSLTYVPSHAYDRH